MTSPEFNPIVRLYDSQKHSLRCHIDAMCAHCMGCTAEEVNPGFRAEVRACSAPDCPLFGVRPFRTKGQASCTKAAVHSDLATQHETEPSPRKVS